MNGKTPEYVGECGRDWKEKESQETPCHTMALNVSQEETEMVEAGFRRAGDKLLKSQEKVHSCQVSWGWL